MSDFEDELPEIEINDEEFPLDSVAARVVAFTRLLALVDHVKNEDALKESILMLRAIRFSFKQLPQGDLTAIPGGKS
jgi:hypothetical protein